MAEENEAALAAFLLYAACYYIRNCRNQILIVLKVKQDLANDRVSQIRHAYVRPGFVRILGRVW
jgi:hypothetical protein